MKIAIITPCFPHPKRGDLTGPERVVENLAIHFKKLGHELKIITTYWNGGNKYDNYRGIPILRIKDSKSIFGKLGSIFLLNHITFGLNAIRKKNFNYYKDSDVIILPLAIGFTKFLKKKKIPVISIYYHFDSPRSITDYLYLPIFHYLETKQFNTHKNIVSISDSSKNEIIYHYKIKSQNINVIPIGVDLDKFSPSNCSKELKSKYGKNILLNSGLMIPRKKVSVLLRAMKNIIKEIPDANLILIGRGPLLNYYKKLSNQLGLQEHTTFLGFVQDEEIAKYYASSDVFVFPSELEGFGQVILEAMASGTPVICANKPPMSEIIGNGGITFKLNDPNDLAKKIIELLKNRNELAKLREGALKIVKNYEWSYIAGIYLDYINIVKK